jgi:hypothetical protein
VKSYSLTCGAKLQPKISWPAWDDSSWGSRRPPRRVTQTIAGAFALTTALVIHAGFNLGAHTVEAIFLAAVLALAVGGFALARSSINCSARTWGVRPSDLPVGKLVIIPV